MYKGDKMKRLFLLIAMLAVILYIAIDGVKVVRIEDEAAITETAFDESMDVSYFWESEAVPEIKEYAVELSELVNQSGGDLESLASEYGRYTMDSSGEINYSVYGSGTVITVETEKKAGYIELEIDGYTGSVVTRIQTGPILKKTAVRDYLSFIDINNYSDQIQYAQLSKNINTYIYENVIGNLDINDLQGKSVTFYGCFTFENNEEILITPVVLEEK